MISALRRLLAPLSSVYPDDQARLAQTLNNALLSSVAFTILGLFATIFIFRNKGMASIMIGLALVSAAGSWALNRAGHMRTASVLWTGGTWAWTTLLMGLSGHFSSVILTYYLGLVVIAGLLHGWQVAAGLTGLSTLAGLGMVVVEQAGWLGNPVFPLPPLSSWILWLTACAQILVPMKLTLQGLAQALNRARSSQQRYTTLYDAAPMMYLTVRDHQGVPTISECNATFLRMMGFDRADVVGRPLADFYTPLSGRALLEGGFQRALQDKMPDLEERDLVARDGRVIHTLLRTTPEFSETGQVIGTLAMYTDLTGRLETEQAQRASEARFRAVVEHTQQGVAFMDAERRFTYANPAHSAWLGYEPAAMLGLSGADLVHPDDQAATAAAFAGLVQAPGLTGTAEYRLLRKDGSICWVETVATNLLEDPDIHAIVLNNRDITERKLTEEALRDNQHFLSDLIENIGALIFVKDLAGRYQLVNRQWESTTGIQRAQAIGKTDHELFPTNAARHFRNNDARVLMDNQLRESDEVLPGLDGPRYFITTKYPLHDATGKLTGLCGMATEITARKKAEQQLLESEARWRSVIHTAHDAILSTDALGQIVAWNPAAELLFGYPETEALGRSLSLLIPELLWDQQRRALLPGSNPSDHPSLGHVVTAFGLARGRREFPLEMSLSRWQVEGNEFYTAIIRDNTERQQAAETIERSLREKEMLLRELYHRTKNNMAVVSSLLHLQAEITNDQRLTRAFTEAQNRIRSMALVHEKLYQAQDLSRVDLMEYIADLARLLWDSYHHAASRIELELDLRSVPVLIDCAVPCGLVLNELISNALLHAFPAGRKGTIAIRLRRMDTGVLRLQVGDNGIGVPTDFDGRHSGRLGLQNVYALVENQLGGQIDLDTRTGLLWTIDFRDDQYRPRI